MYGSDSGVAISGQPKGISATGKDGELAIATQSGIYVMLNGEVMKKFEGKINYTPTAVTASAAGTEIAVGADVSSLIFTGTATQLHSSHFAEQ